MLRRARSHLLVATLTLAPLLVVPGPANATVMVRRNVDEMTHAADLVVVGRVRESSARWINGRIFTEHTIAVERVARGNARAGTSLTLRTPGGVVGDTGQHIAGAPVLARSDQYVLFLRLNARGVYETVGLSQGVLPIRLATATGAPDIVMPPSTDGLEFAEPAAVQSPSVVIPREGMGLEDLLRAVHALP